MMTDQQKLESTRKEAGLTTKQAADMLKVKEVTFQRWEGQTARKTVMPDPIWQYFLLLIDRHPVYQIIERAHPCTTQTTTPTA